MFQIPTLRVWILTEAELLFFFNQQLGAHPSVLKSNWGFLTMHFYSAVEMIILKSGWLMRNVAA